MKGEEKWLKGSEPITDLCYFSAKVNDIGRLDQKSINIATLPQALRKQKRIHLAISAPSSRSLMYWCLSKDKETRQGLLDDIVSMSKPFDGVQIDFETIRAEEKLAYLSFLKELRAHLPKEKIFSVAVPARTRKLEDAFDYKQIAEIADKVLIMAYDEHWSSGEPGPIASTKWCKRVCEHAKETIPTNKIVMGIPLYGRVWQKKPIAKALKYHETLQLWKKYPNLITKDPDGTPHFEFQETVEAAVYFENLDSLSNKLDLYQANGISAIGFWRATQEPAALWKQLVIKH